MPKEKQTLNYPVPFRDDIAAQCSAARANDGSLTYAAFAEAHDLNESTVRAWVAKTEARPAQQPANEIYKSRKSKYNNPVVEEWLVQRLRQGDVTVADILRFVEANEPALLRGESYNGKRNACTWLKKKAQKTIDGFVKINTDASTVPSSRAKYHTKCRCKSKCGSTCRNRKKMIECVNSNCGVGFDACTNRPIQRGESSKMEKKACGEGFGLFALETIKTGTFIIEYIGDIISKEAKAARHQAKRDAYIFQVNNSGFIDSFTIGNESRFINHSCNPNCRAEGWTIGGSRRVAIFAIKTITPGDQVTYDYGPSYMIDDCLCIKCKSTRK